MLEPITIFTTTLAIINLINQTDSLLTAINAAPREFRALAAKVKSLALVLESVRTNLVKNQQSIINRSRDLHEEKNLDLDDLIKSCEKSLKRVEKLFKHYRGVLRGGLWSGWDWTSRGRAEVQATLDDLQSLTQLVGLFIQKEVAQGVGRLEGMAAEERVANRNHERHMRALFEHFGIPEPPDPGKDLRKLFATSVFASRWVGRLRARKVPQQSGRVNKPTPTRRGSKNILTQVPNLQRRNSLRSANCNTRTAVPKPATTNSSIQLKGIRVASASYVLGPSIHAGKPLKLTQSELQELVNRAQTGTRSIDKRHHAVKWLMRQQGPKWSFAAGRDEGGDRFAIVLKKVS